MADKDEKGCPGDNNDKSTSKIEVRDKIHRTPPQSKSSQNANKPKGNISPTNKTDTKVTKSVNKDNKSSNEKDQFLKPKDKPGKSSDKNSSNRKDGKKQHQSRTLEKTNSSQNRRSTSSKKRPRKDSTDDEGPNTDSDFNNSKDETMEDIYDENLPCPTCERNFEKEEDSVFCSCCTQRFHGECQDLDEKAIACFKYLGKAAHFYCKNCSAGASKLYKVTVACKERLDAVERKVKVIEEDKEAVKKDVSALKSQQGNNTTKIKTLDNVHKTLRLDVDDLKSSIKSLKDKEKTQNEEKEKMKSTQDSNTLKLTTVATRLNTISDDIVGRIKTIIDERVDEKLKEKGEETTQPYTIDDEKLQEELTKKIQEKVDKIDDDKVKQDLDTKLLEKVNNINIENPYLPAPDMDMDVAIGTTSKPQVSRVFTSAVNNVITERDLIERRKLQVVITQLEENTNTGDDLKDAKEIFTIMQCNNISIVECLRVGKRKAERPRPLRITLETMQDKRNLLSKATTLRNVPDTSKYANVYVKPNLTILQQEQAKNLYVQLKEVRLKNPLKTYKISKGKIIEVPLSQ